MTTLRDEVGDGVLCWLGRPIKDMTRDELEKAFEQLANLYAQSLASGSEHTRVLARAIRGAGR